MDAFWEYCEYLGALLSGAIWRAFHTVRAWLFLVGIGLAAAGYFAGKKYGMSDGQAIAIFLGLAVLSLVFQMFGEAYALHKSQQTKIETLERVPSIRRQVLGGWRRFGVQLLGEQVATEDALSDWEKRVDDWHATVGDCLTKFYDSARADSVLLLGTYDKNRPFDGSLNDYHRWKRLMLKDRLERLGALLESDSL